MLNDALERALAPLRDGPVPLASNSDTQHQRERILPLLRGEVRGMPERLRRRTLRRRLVGAGVGSGLLAAAAALGFLLSPPAALEDPLAATLRIEPLGSSGLRWADPAGNTLEVGSALGLPARGILSANEVSAARLTTPTGIQVQIAERTQVDLSALAGKKARSALRLLEGAVEIRVPKLAAGEQFSVVTPDAEVVVHGTVFSVRSGESGKRGTCVRVREGLVAVHHKAGVAQVPAGASWGCEPPAEEAAVATRDTASTAAVEPVPAAPRLALRERRREARSAPPDKQERSAAASGTLAQENRLLAAALSAERAGEPERARRLLVELLDRYPSSPLAPEAEGALERVR